MNRRALMVGGAIAVAALVAGGAWLTMPQDRQAASRPRETIAPTAAAPATQADARPPAIELPQPEAPLTPPTSADFAAAGSTTPAPSDGAQADGRQADGAPQGGDVDWAAMPIDTLRDKANAGAVVAMEELARRLVQGDGVPKDQQAGAGWLLRAAQAGSPQAAFNVGVMYERGFVVPRDSSEAITWYRKAVAADLPAAKHNLALLLRDGKGAPRDAKAAVELLRSAARQGMAASMFTLGDIYERGDTGLKDPATALAWFAIAAEFERQTSKDGESALGRMAGQRAEVLQRILLPAELERAQQFGRAEFKTIVDTLQPPQPATPSDEAASPGLAASPSLALAPAPTSVADPPGWPQEAADQVRAIQQALVELKFLNDKPDGALGPLTQAAIRTFQRSLGMRETGAPSREVFAALQDALARRGGAANPTEAQAEEPRAKESGAALGGWPETETEQVKAIQLLLQALKFLRDEPDGVAGPATRTAIRDYQKSLGLPQTGEPSEALFDSLKDMRRLTQGRAN